MIKACIADAGIETKGTHFPKPEVLDEIFSLAANTHKTTDDMLESQYDYFSQFSCADCRPGAALRQTEARDERDGF